MKNIRSTAASLAIAATLSACGTGSDKSHDACMGRQNPDYHISYFEICGNSEKPVTNGNEKTVTLWVEVDSPFSATGKAWFDDIYLERSDAPGVNLLKDYSPSFGNGDAGWQFPEGAACVPAICDRANSPDRGWRHLENAMCVADNTTCTGLDEYQYPGTIWALDREVFHSSPAAVRADMNPLGQGYQTHIFACPLICVAGISSGVEFKASAYVKIEGDIQVRLGIDFRSDDPNPSNPRQGIRAVNGRVIQGSTDWAVLQLR